MRDTTFRFALAPTAEQASTLARHCGASRFALNQCLQLVMVSVSERRGRGLPFRPAPSAAIAEPGVGSSGGRFVGIDRGLAAFAVVAGADGVEICRFTAPGPLIRRLGRLRQRSRALSRAQRGSGSWVNAARLLAREPHGIADIRRSFCMRSRASLQDPQRAGHRGASCRQPASQQAPRPGHHGRRLDRVLPPSFDTRQPGSGRARGLRSLVPLHQDLLCLWLGRTTDGLGTRVFRCGVCGLVMDRDRNAAANLAAWAEAATSEVEQAPDRQQAAGSSMPQERGRWPSRKRWRNRSR